MIAFRHPRKNYSEWVWVISYKVTCSQLEQGIDCKFSLLPSLSWHRCWYISWNSNDPAWRRKARRGINRWTMLTTRLNTYEWVCSTGPRVTLTTSTTKKTKFGSKSPMHRWHSKVDWIRNRKNPLVTFFEAGIDKAVGDREKPSFQPRYVAKNMLTFANR